MDKAIEKFRKRRAKRLKIRMDAEEGRWVTTENDHKVHLNEEGKPDKGNPHVIEKMTVADKSNDKKRQAEYIQRVNPAVDSYHTWIRSEDDILTFDEVADEMCDTVPDVTRKMVEQARKTGKIKVYSSHNIKGGTFVTPSKMIARDYAGSGTVKEMVVPVDHVAWIDGEQGQYIGDMWKDDKKS